MSNCCGVREICSFMLIFLRFPVRIFECAVAVLEVALKQVWLHLVDNDFDCPARYWNMCDVLWWKIIFSSLFILFFRREEGVCDAWAMPMRFSVWLLPWENRLECLNASRVRVWRSDIWICAFLFNVNWLLTPCWVSAMSKCRPVRENYFTCSCFAFPGLDLSVWCSFVKSRISGACLSGRNVMVEEETP